MNRIVKLFVSLVPLTIALGGADSAYCQQAKRSEAKDAHDRYVDQAKPKSSNKHNDGKPKDGKSTQTNPSAKSGKDPHVTMDPLPADVKKAPERAR